MKKISVFLCAMFLVFGVTGVAMAVPSFLSGVDAASGFYDVNKDFDGDDNNLCWAATASNMLAYSGWDGGFATEYDMFDEFKFHWSNEYGHHYYGIEWWFSGVDNNFPADLDTPIPGGTFYSAADFSANIGYGSTTNMIMDWAVGNVADDRVWGLLLGFDDPGTGDPTGLHCVTAWGYDNYTGAGDTTSTLYITDSDMDLVTATITPYDFVLSGGKWYIQNYDGFANDILYAIDSTSLGLNDPHVDPNPHHPHDLPIPEPATMLLLGTGLLGLCSYRKRKRA